MQPGAVPQSRPMMTIQESVKTCIRKYADFSGRATRAEFWWWVLATTIVSFALSTIDSFVSALSGLYVYSPLGSIFGLAILLPNLAVTARRLHDIGKSGWWQLVWIALGILGVIPLVAGVVVGLVAAFSGGFSWQSFVQPAFWIPFAIGLFLSLLIWIGIFIWWLVWMVRQGQSGTNYYGPDPRAWFEGEDSQQTTL